MFSGLTQLISQNTLKTGAMVRLRAPSYAARMRQSTSIPSLSVCSGRVPERKQSAKCPISDA